MHAKPALTTKLPLQPPNADRCPQAWVLGLGSRVGRVAGGASARVLSLCELAGGCL